MTKKKLKELYKLEEGVYLLRVNPALMMGGLTQLFEVQKRLWKAKRFVEFIFAQEGALEFIPGVKKND